MARTQALDADGNGAVGFPELVKWLNRQAYDGRHPPHPRMCANESENLQVFSENVGEKRAPPRWLPCPHPARCVGSHP